jgi:hypothetical protein
VIAPYLCGTLVNKGRVDWDLLLGDWLAAIGRRRVKVERPQQREDERP